MRALGVLFILLAAPFAAASQRAPEEVAAICDAAAGAAPGGVPAASLRALTRTETGRRVGGALLPWPWTVNMEGEGFWFDTREEALAFVRARHAAGARSFDMGCFQINFRWHGEAFDSLDAMFEPSLNAAYAARFLNEL
ncbi:MAG: lytic transglycosylase domain-containing protein, partial [Pikeienuella sp.]